MSEAQEQRLIFEHIEYIKEKYPELTLLLHIPNGGSRNIIEATNLKRQGVKAGVPDLFLPCARGCYHGLFIELKTKAGKISPSQQKWIESLSNEQYLAIVCYGYASAMTELTKYCELDGIENEPSK